ncbi:MAG: cobyrinate a,c-diamide synthase, partial [Cyanobacteria bacterium P01_H01_bin.119]
MGLIIAGERSGVGKTTVTLALLAAIAQQNQLVQSFKVGPDYIDPMFHQAVTHRASHNLDPVLTSETYVRQCYERQAQTAECCLIEGVMGLFDGAAGAAGCDAPGSTAHIARILGLPVALVIDCSRLSNSVAAIAHGFSTFDPRLRLAGVILNRVGSDRHLDLLKASLLSLDLPILGVLRRQDSITLPDRHLGLVPAEEVGNFRAIVAELGALGRRCFDWQQLMPLLKAQLKAQPERKRVTETSDFTTRIHPTARPAIAIARDSAFNFYYPDNLDQLAALGAELVAWSPMADAALPAGCQGLYLGGGFPEVFAAELSQSKRARQSIRQAIAAGVPT